MEIKRSSWHYKISNLGSGFERHNDNLCYYFWRLMGKTIFLLAVMSWVYLMIYHIFLSGHLIPNTIMLLFICSSVALPILAINFIRKKLGKSPEMPYRNIVVEYMAAKKRKVCPLIIYI